MGCTLTAPADSTARTGWVWWLLCRLQDTRQQPTVPCRGELQPFQCTGCTTFLPPVHVCPSWSNQRLPRPVEARIARITTSSQHCCTCLRLSPGHSAVQTYWSWSVHPLCSIETFCKNDQRSKSGLQPCLLVRRRSLMCTACMSLWQGQPL